MNETERVAVSDFLIDTGWTVPSGEAPSDQAALSVPQYRRGGWRVTMGSASKPWWLDHVLERLVGLLELPHNWDSYGASTVGREEVERALGILASTMTEGTPIPSIVPTSRGSVQLEWHLGGVDLEVESLEEETVAVSFEDLRSGEEWESELAIDSPELKNAIEQVRKGSQDRG